MMVVGVVIIAYGGGGMGDVRHVAWQTKFEAKKFEA
jgi:hypothetical protein